MLDIYTLSGRINSLEKKFINYEKLKRLIESRTIEEFINLLEGTFFKIPHISVPEDILNFFENERLKLIEEIKKTFEGEIVHFFLLKYDYHNLAVIVEGKENYSFYGNINFYTLKEAFQKNDISKIPEFLKSGFKIIRSSEQIKNKILLLKIDYYQTLYKIAEKISEFTKNYVKIEIDFANLETYLNLKIFEEKIEFSKFIENGNIKVAYFLNEDILKKSFNSKYKKEIQFSEINIEIEKYGILIDYLKVGRIMPYGIDKIISFYIAREIEIKNLQNLTLSKFYKQEGDFLNKISIKPYQYREDL